MSSNEIKIAGTSRTEFGKGAARRARRDGLVPAVIYGHGSEPVHINLPGHETLLALRTANALLSITIDGGKQQLALPKQVQRDPIKGFLDHVDLIVVRKGEKVTVEVPLVIIGEVKEGIVTMDQQTIALEAEATNIPAQVEIDVTTLEVGQQITAGDLTLPEGSVFSGEADDLILSIAAPISEEALEASLEAGEGDAAAAASAEEDAAAEGDAE
ncbi:50S ribosomal protein L25/general stress protein Ctc [Propioniciclava sinopodophylli]|uniref:Large ribosomal subunit protein bL25 n=1 Tax=Propioniciclava sinopodophylli TaxID=1837344 RepID=A0A4V2JS75_9ACTN|nr:50S ribosomal protein L25/general stress protein Ctc [Propioniciclava sinopodophylli]TBT82900.1 50S ribosomal protein L25/general stress protein Ctc [Propioniciclava sinopodophylli]